MTKKEQKYVNSIKEENEKLKNMLVRFVDALVPTKNICDDIGISLIPLMSEENQKIITEIKAETVKEFARKIFSEIQAAISSNESAIRKRLEKYYVKPHEDNFCLMCETKIIALDGIRNFIFELLKETVGVD